MPCYRHNTEFDTDSVLERIFLRKLNLKKVSRRQKSQAKLLSKQRVNSSKVKMKLMNFLVVYFTCAHSSPKAKWCENIRMNISGRSIS